MTFLNANTYTAMSSILFLQTLCTDPVAVAELLACWSDDMPTVQTTGTLDYLHACTGGGE